MAEIVTLTTPLPAAAVLRIADVDFNIRGAMIRIVLAEWANGVFVPNGREVVREYSGAQATAMMTALNKANLTTISLNTRIMTQLITDGLQGTVSGGAA